MLHLDLLGVLAERCIEVNRDFKVPLLYLVMLCKYKTRVFY